MSSRLIAPIVTVYLVVAIVMYNLALLANGNGYLTLDTALGNNYNRTLHMRELWRPFTSWIPHIDLEHVVWDVCYLLVAGSIFEVVWGRRRLIAVFFLGTFTGSWLCAFFDTRYGEVVGSSAGTHAIVAFFCVREVLDKSAAPVMRLAWLTVLVYLFYLTVYGLAYGTMGWPLEFFKNSGFDHLGGITTAIVLAFADHYGYHNKMPEKAGYRTEKTVLGQQEK